MLSIEQDPDLADKRIFYRYGQIENIRKCATALLVSSQERKLCQMLQFWYEIP